MVRERPSAATPGRPVDARQQRQRVPAVEEDLGPGRKPPASGALPSTGATIEGAKAAAEPSVRTVRRTGRAHARPVGILVGTPTALPRRMALIRIPSRARPSLITACLLLSSSSSSGCATQRLPPRAAPERAALPIVTSGAPGAGRGRVILDVADGPARVTEVLASGVARSGDVSASYATGRDICRTPCVADLELGPHALRFVSLVDETKASDLVINVVEQAIVYRHALGTERTQTPRILGGALATIVAAASFGTGVTLLGTYVDQRVPDEGHLPAALALTAGGIGLGVLSYLLFRDAGDIVQEGATTQWAYDEPAAASTEGRAGVGTTPAAPAQLGLRLTDRDGVRVVEILEGAARGKLRVGDVILAVDEIPMPDTRAVRSYLARLRVGDRARIVVRREGMIIEAEVAL